LSGDAELVGPDLRGELVALVGDRLAAGEPLISHGHFHKAMEEGYRALRGSFPSQAMSVRLGEVAHEIVAENPEAFAVPGVENWIVRALLGIVRKRGWGITEVQERGPSELRDFLKQEQVRTVLAQLDLTPQELNVRNCMRSVSNAVAGKEDPQKKRAAARLAQLMGRLKKEGQGEGAPNNLSQLLAGPASEPDEREIAERTQEQKKGQAALRAKQMQILVQNLDSYVKEGRVSAEDAERLRQLHQVEQALRSGKVDREKGSKIRNTILSGTARDSLEKKMREEVDYVIVYAQFFEGLQRIDPRFDAALRFLIAHKDAVNAEAGDEVDWKPVVNALIGEYDTMHRVIEMMDRQDAEVRMMAARLPPYSHVIRRGQDRVERLWVDGGFVDDLRACSKEDIVLRLNAPERKERAKLAAAMLSVSALVLALIEATPFRKQMRLLKINLIVEEFFRSSEDIGQAREKAQEFLRNRLQKLYPDITEEESAEIQERGAEMIAAAEKKVLAEREAERKEKAEKGGGETETTDVVDERLSDDEKEMGVQFGRVSIRTGAGDRMIPYKIMPDPDDTSLFVLAKRDKELDTLVPVMRRGKKRYVEKNKEGVWELIVG
jgi:hypothetical protein